MIRFYLTVLITAGSLHLVWPSVVEETLLGEMLQTYLYPQSFLLETCKASLWCTSTCFLLLFSLDGSIWAKHFKWTDAPQCQRMSETKDNMCSPNLRPVPYTLNEFCIWNFLHVVCQVHIPFALWETSFLCSQKDCHSLLPWETWCITLSPWNGGRGSGKRGTKLSEAAWKKLD